MHRAGNRLRARAGLALASGVSACLSTVARAEVTEASLARRTRVAFPQFNVRKYPRLPERHAAVLDGLDRSVLSINS